MRLSCSTIKHLITSNTVIKSKDLVPEVKLHLIDKTCPWYHQSSVPELSDDPFWAIFWPGGQALSRFVLDNPGVVRQRRVLDLGCGCGGTSIASLMCGAQSVVSNDIDKVAMSSVRLNSQLNDTPCPEISTENLLTKTLKSQQSDSVKQQATVNLETSKHQHVVSTESFQSQHIAYDETHPPQNTTRCSDSLTRVHPDVMFLGDMFYEEKFARRVLDRCIALHRQGTDIYIGDPGRWGLEFVREYLSQVAEYAISDEDCEEYRTVNVFKFSNNT